MSEDRRAFSRRTTETTISISTLEGQILDTEARIINLSVGGIRIASPAELLLQQGYRARLANTDTWFEILIIESIGAEYRCRIVTPWEDLYEVIRQSDDLTLLVLEASDPDEEIP